MTCHHHHKLQLIFVGTLAKRQASYSRQDSQVGCTWGACKRIENENGLRASLGALPINGHDDSRTIIERPHGKARSPCRPLLGSIEASNRLPPWEVETHWPRICMQGVHVVPVVSFGSDSRRLTDGNRPKRNLRRYLSLKPTSMGALGRYVASWVGPYPEA